MGNKTFILCARDGDLYCAVLPEAYVANAGDTVLLDIGLYATVIMEESCKDDVTAYEKAAAETGIDVHSVRKLFSLRREYAPAEPGEREEEPF